MTPFAALQSLCGLSNREAAEFLAVSEDTVKSWRSGRRPAPDGSLSDLLELSVIIDSAAAFGADDIMRQSADAGAVPAEIKICYPADDAEAQALGLPCLGSWRQMAGRLIDALAVMCADTNAWSEVLTRIRFVPRASTPSPAAAADAHNR